MAPATVPPVPVKHSDFLHHVQSNPNTPIEGLVKPYNDYDAVLRRVFAQEPTHPALQDNHLNLVPLYDNAGTSTASVRARNLASEPPELKQKYLLHLKPEDRKPNGSPAVVPSVQDFQTNFSIFTEGSLSDLDWNNVVVAGSAVVTCLMPVPEKFRDSKRSLRQFYHEEFAPASDVDLFLYGLTEEQAIEKIRHIENKIKGSILYETTTIRTKNTITIASQYPTRHVQIVLRIYKSISEMLTGFDVDCSCAAYDGKQVYVSPRALASYITQVNKVDLTRRSPSYENRLSKYGHRGFEVFWPGLDRSRIDPTVFERSFARTVGLARLLVLEQLPKSFDRESYIAQRRRERGRPMPRKARRYRSLRGNIKDQWEDEAPEWLEEDEISDYNTLTIPYGHRYHARKIEKLLYTKDLLLNAEWNRPKDREVNLHRHPAFFGNLGDVIHDCCRYCPQPETEEDKQVAEEEAKVYISGDVSFIKDDPGRQEIGSFNPTTETDWTEMAYVGNTERLCQAIVEHNLEEVKDWLAQEGSDPNTRDYTGRTPLQLACMTSTPEIVQSLVDHGARMISRVADGRTALHLAAARGDRHIVRILLTKSEHNEEEEAKKKELQKRGREIQEPRERTQRESIGEGSGTSEHQGDESDLVMVGESKSATTGTLGSFVKLGIKDGDETTDNISEDDDDLDPDIYDVNVLSWDNRTSPLHLAILNGHVNVVEELVGSFGADVLLPIKLLDDYSNSPRAAILTLVLALRLPLEKAKAMTEKLLQLGASPAQADLKSYTPLHYLASSGYMELLDAYIEQDQPAVKRVIKHLAFTGYFFNAKGHSALTIAIDAGDVIGAIKLLDGGAGPSIGFDDFMKSAQVKNDRLKRNSSETNHDIFEQNMQQPVIAAVNKGLPLLAFDLIARGVDPNTLNPGGYTMKSSHAKLMYTTALSLLDLVRRKLAELRNYDQRRTHYRPPQPLDADDSTYFNEFEDGTYQMWTAQRVLKDKRKKIEQESEQHEKRKQDAENRQGLAEKMAAVNTQMKDFEKLEHELLEKGAKTFKELFPEKEEPDQNSAAEPGEPEPFKVKFTFKVPDLTEVKKNGYMRLFEAAWSGDLATVKSLALAKWGPNNEQLPLRVSLEDNYGFSPFSIAVLRGHLPVAKSILEIVEAQYKPREVETSNRYQLDEEAVQVYSEVINDKYTFENIGEVAIQVECDIKPLEALEWTGPVTLFMPSEHDWSRQDEPDDLIGYAIWKDDVELLVFLLELGQELTARDASSETAIYGISRNNFKMALRLGRLRCIMEMIQRTGGGLPIDALVRKSGVELQEKPRYYQGLSIHGKKRPDWASAGYGGNPFNQLSSPPLLEAALLGNLESTEWFLGTAAGRYYNAFTGAHKHDNRLKKLEESKLGLEGTVMKWLGLRHNLVLHCAVMSQPTGESQRLVQYLVDEYPALLETKSAEGYTPLQLAFSLHHEEFSRTLVNAGANQTVRDRKGRNLIHIVLGGISRRYKKNPKAIQSLLGLVDSRLIPSMLTERCSDSPGSLTPFAYWMSKAAAFSSDYYFSYDARNFNMRSETSDGIAIVRTILDLAENTGQKHLELLNGAGSTPMHVAVAQQLPKTLELMIDCRPDLLHREDATGVTPFELAVNLWVNEITSHPPFPLVTGTSNGLRWSSDVVLDRPPESFVSKTDRRSKRQIICDLCREQGSHGTKRKLVTLYEANEVAKRLAANKSGRVVDDEDDRSEPDYDCYEESLDWADGPVDEKVDEVTKWYYRAEMGYW
ncbi:ankyrin repeat protein [Aspergillus sp. HF37]|nr:ankyrin repeat protein [Aspergillus sp. HF37]